MSNNTENEQEKLQQQLWESLNSLLCLTQKVEFYVYEGLGLFTSKTEKFQNPAYKASNPEDFIYKESSQSFEENLHSKDLNLYLKPIINHLTNQNLSFTILDIGGYIGIFSLKASLCCRSLGIDTKIFCFEPGPTTHLIEANININGFKNTICLVEKAASYVTGNVLYHYQPNSTITGRLFKHSKASYSKIIQAQTIDNFIEENNDLSEVLIIKIDTEGYEHNVLKGMTTTIETKLCILVLEFWPWTLDYKIDQQKYGDYLLEKFILIDINNSEFPQKFNIITANNFVTFTEEIKSSPRGCTDVLCLPKNLANVNDLANKISIISKK